MYDQQAEYTVVSDDIIDTADILRNSVKARFAGHVQPDLLSMMCQTQFAGNQPTALVWSAFIDQEKIWNEICNSVSDCGTGNGPSDFTSVKFKQES